MTTGPYTAVIFDMDGVLVDGEPLHFEAVNLLLAEEGRSISLDQYQPYMGTKSGWQELIRDFALTRPYAHYRDRYLPLLVEQYRTRSMALPGAIEIVGSLRRAGVPLALASSSIRPWVQAALESIGLDGRFDVVVTGSEITEGKPDPEIYLLAASQLGLAPERCLAIEDAPAGIESAHAAGMHCWAIRTEYTRGLPLPNPEREFESLVDVELRDILGVAA
ncbi:MAG: HAD family phosphatase [Dehalococcoidia bacterium]